MCLHRIGVDGLSLRFRTNLLLRPYISVLTLECSLASDNPIFVRNILEPLESLLLFYPFRYRVIISITNLFIDARQTIRFILEPCTLSWKGPSRGVILLISGTLHGPRLRPSAPGWTLSLCLVRPEYGSAMSQSQLTWVCCGKCFLRCSGHDTNFL